MKLLAYSLMLILLVGCGKKGEEEEKPETPKPRSGASGLIDHVTGKHAVEQGKKARKQLEEISEKKNKQLEEIMPEQ